MKIKSPILYDKNGNIICWFEQEISAELIAQLKWGAAHAIKNSKESWRTPIFEDKEK